MRTSWLSAKESKFVTAFFFVLLASSAECASLEYRTQSTRRSARCGKNAVNQAGKKTTVESTDFRMLTTKEGASDEGNEGIKDGKDATAGKPSFKATSTSAIATNDSKNSISSSSKLQMKNAGKFSIRTNSEGTSLRTSSEGGTNFSLNESIKSKKNELKEADISDGGKNSINSRGEKNHDGSATRNIKIEAEGKSEIKAATTESTVGTMVDSASSVKFKSDSVQKANTRERESLNKTVNGTKVTADKAVESKLAAEASNTINSEGKTTLASLGDGKQNKAVVKSEKGITGGTSLVAQNTESGSLTGSIEKNGEKKTTGGSYVKKDQIKGDADFSLAGKTDLSTLIDIQKGFSADGDSAGEAKINNNVDVVSESSTKNADKRDSD